MSDIIRTSADYAQKLLEAMYKLGNLGKTVHGDYMVATEDGGWTTLSLEDAASHLSENLADVDGICRILADSGSDLPELDMLDLVIRGRHYPVPFDDETALGEPCAWVYLADETSIEVVHEESDLGLKEQYYSARLHCSQEDFDNDVYHKTMGIIDQACGGLSEIAPFIIREATARCVIPMEKTVPVKITVPFAITINVPIPDGDLLEAYNGEEDAIARAVEEALDTLPGEIGNGVLTWSYVYDEVKVTPYDPFYGIYSQSQKHNPDDTGSIALQEKTW